MFRAWADLHVIWTFFIFPLELQTDRHARTHIITQLNRQGDKHIHKQLVVWEHANDPELRTLHWAMLLNVDLSLFAKINSSFWSGPRSDC